MIPSFAMPWWRHLGQGQLALTTARADTGELVAIAPLHSRRLLGARVVRWLGHGVGAVGHIVGVPEHAQTLWQRLVDTDFAFDLVDVPASAQPAQLPNVTIGRTAENACPFASLEPGWSLDDYLTGSHRKRARRELSRVAKRLDTAGAALRVAVHRTAGEVASALPDVRAIFDASEAAQPRLHLLAGDLEPFFIEALHEAAARSQLALLVAYIDDRPAAFDVLVTVGSTSYTILGRYHPAEREWGVGHVLMRDMAAEALARGSARLDLQIGDDDYKQAWADERYRVDHLVIAPARFVGGVTRGLELRESLFDQVYNNVLPKLRSLRA